MLNRVANETTIHGIKEAWEANRSGRIFYFLVFVVCFILMVLQLRGLFSSYINEEVGTRVRSSTKSNTSNAYAFYYCNSNWLPKVEALDRFNHSEKTTADQLYQNCMDIGRTFVRAGSGSSPFDFHHFGFNRSREYYNLKTIMIGFITGQLEIRSYEILDHYSIRRLGIRDRWFSDVKIEEKCKQYIEYWKTVLIQEIINAAVTPLEDRRRPLSYHRTKRPVIDASEKPFIVHLLAERINPFLEVLSDKNVKGFIEENVLNVSLGEFMTDQNDERQDIYYNSTITAMPHAFDAGNDVDADYGQRLALARNINSTWFRDGSKINGANHTTRRRTYFDLESIYGPRLNPIRIAASLDGVCWEHATDGRNSLHNIKRHVIIHLGGLVHHLRRLTELKFYTDGAMDSHSFEMAFSFADAVGGMHQTHAAVSVPSHMNLYFHHKIRIDSDISFVRVRFWKESSVRLDRKTERCVAGTWTDLDQAHCNQEYALTEGNLRCETYLPASANYPETRFTNHTCIYDHTGVFSDIARGGERRSLWYLRYIGERERFRRSPTDRDRFDELASSWARLDSRLSQQISDLLSSFNPKRLSNDSRNAVIQRLTMSNPRCPAPCSKTTYSNEVSYPVPSHENIQECHLALANFLTPIIDSYYLVPTNPAQGGGRMRVEGKAATENLFWHLYKYISNKYHSTTPYCSVIEYEEMEDLAQKSEEYFLYGWSDLASSLGGSLSLWIGASAISFAQLAYICCWERLFKKLACKGRIWQKKDDDRSKAPAPPIGRSKNTGRGILPVRWVLQ